MHILYLHQYFNTPDMSGGTRSYEMAKRLVKMGHQVEMVTSWRENDGRKDWFVTQEAGINVHWLPVPYLNKMGFAERIAAFAKFALGAAKKAIQLDGDVVFATSTPLTIAIPGIIASKIKSIPMVFEVRDLWPEVPIQMGILKNPLFILAAKILEKLAYFNSSKIVALAPGMKDHIASLKYPCEKITVIPNAADIDFFLTVSNEKKESIISKFSFVRGKKVILYAGAIGIANFVNTLVPLAAELKKRNSNICFVILGDGKKIDSLRKYAQKEKVLDENFYMLGKQSKKDIPAWLKIASLACLTYNPHLTAIWKDSVCNKFFDAIASETPICCNFIGWSQKILQEMGGVLYLDSDNPKQAANLLEEKLNEKDWLVSAKKACRNLAKARFSRDDQAKKLEKVLQSVVKKGA